MYRETRKRKIIIFSLIGILLLMAIGYAAFQTNLDVKGNSQITSNWDVEIINVKEGEKTGLAESAKTPTWTKTEASMETNLYQKGDSMSYIVTIENKGSFDAKLDNINLGKGTNEEAVNITFSGYTKGQTLFKGTTTDITVTISYNPNYEGGETSSEVNTDFEFSQAEGGTITPTTDHLVTYDYLTNGGTSSNSENEYLPEGSNIKLDYTAEKEGYEFVGWNTNASAREGLKDIQINEDTTLYAIFKKDLNVTYEMGEGVTSTEKEAEVCSLYNNDKTCEITLPEITVNTAKGYEIDGWYNGDTKIGDSSDKYEINSDITLTAKAKEPEPIMQSWSVNSSSDFHNSTYKSNITSVEILTNKDVPEDAVASWDVSSKKNGSVMAWVINDPNNAGKYKLYIGGNGGVIANSNSGYLFRNFTGVTEMNLSNLDTSKVTGMAWMFDGCGSLTTLDLINFDTSNVTNMSYMFRDCDSLTSLDVSNFDTSKVIDMVYMFYNCSSLTELDLSKWDTSKVTDMSYMFYNCDSLTELDVSNFDTSSVTSMRHMFYNCDSLTELDVSNFDTSKVTNMYRMFSGCSGLTELDVSNFDTSKVTDMRNMFDGCSSLTELDVSNFYTSNVTNMSFMFSYCSGLTELDVSNFDTSKVTDMSYMFYGCSSLNELDVSNFDTSKVTNMSYMFRDCGNLTKLVLCSFDTSKVTNMNEMFRYTSKLDIIYVGPNWTTENAITTNMFSNSGVSSVTQSDNCEIESEDPANISVSTTKTTNSITVSVSASAPSNISKYEYSKDGGKSWVEGSTNLYTFTELTEGTEYDIMVRVTSGKGKQTTSEITKVTTNTIGIPTFTESEISNGKRVTITYPEGCGSKYTCTYQKDNEGSVNVTSTTVNVTFTDSGSVVARVSDGTNTASSSYNVTVIVDITDNVVTSGDGLYADEYTSGRYVYRGADPNNYIEFNNELWRIIAKEADGTYKILRNETLPSRKFDSVGARTTGYCSQASINGCNAWSSTASMVGSPSEFTNGSYTGTVDADSEMLTYLNGEYLNSITVNKEKIVNHDYNIGAVVSNNNDLATQIEGEKSYKWNGKVGLISHSDYINANSNQELCGTDKINYENYETCRNDDWMYISGTWWWTLSPLADGSDNIWYVNLDGKISNIGADFSYGVRPAVYLTSSLSLSGSGTSSDPFVIG